MSTVPPRGRLPHLLVLAVLALGAVSPLAAGVVYDFVAKAPGAKWRSGQGAIPWGSSESDSRGFARHLANRALENGKTFALVLETHPEWKANGWIYGVYENIQVPARVSFSATVGFLAGATATDGVTFRVFILDPSGGSWQLLASKAAKSDGVLDDLSADLGAYAGKTVSFRLQVNAGATSTQDWAVWAAAAIVAPEAARPLQQAPAAVGAAKPQSSGPAGPATIQKFRPAVIGRIPLIPAGEAPPQTKIEDIGPLPIEEPLTLLNHIYKDNEKPNTYYYLPREIDLIRDPASGNYRVSAVWTQDQKIRTTLTLQANIDPEDVKVMEEALRASKGSAALLKSMPYEEANIIDLKGWEDWKIEDIRIPTFGSLETELPVSIAMTPETLAQLKPLLEKEGLTAGMRIKTGEKEMGIPIKIGLKYFTGRWYSPLAELGFSYDERASLLTLHNVRNLTGFPLKIGSVSLRFRLPAKEEVYKDLACDPAVTIPPGEFRDVKARLVLRDQLLAEYRKVYPVAPPGPKPNPLGQLAMGLLKSELEKARDKGKPQGAEAGRSVPADPKADAFFKTYARSFWMTAAPDFDCQACLDKIWGSIEVVSYIERMRKVNIEALASVFDPSAYETPRAVEKLHLEIRSPYLSAQAKEGLMAAVDLTKDKLKDAVTVYLPLATGETFAFEYRIKAILKTGESAESADWEKVVDSLDLTLGTFHVNKIFQK